MQKKVMNYIFTIIAIIIVIVVIILIGTYQINKNKPEDINAKLTTEMSYLDHEILSVINSLNNLDTEFLIMNNKINSTNNQSETSGGSSSSSGSSSGGKSSSNGGSSGQNSSSGTQQSSQNQTNSTIVSTMEPKSILSRNRNDIDWKFIQSELEEINNSWVTITIDLNSVNTPNNDILAFNTNMDNALKYVKDKDKQNSLISIANLYSIIPKYEESYENSNKTIKIAYIKSDIVSSYALLDTGKWDNIYSFLSDADTKLAGLVNSTDNKNENLQKSYVLLKDYIKSTNDKDVDLCYMKYYYVMKELDDIK